MIMTTDLTSAEPREDGDARNSGPPWRKSAEPTKENTCAIIVIYYPDDRFGERLERINEQFSKTIVVDNTPTPLRPI